MFGNKKDLPKREPSEVKISKRKIVDPELNEAQKDDKDSPREQAKEEGSTD